MLSVGRGRMDVHLRDRVYLVTGGSRGLGFAAAEALVAEGAHVILSAPHEGTAAAAAARLTRDAAAANRVAWVAADNADAATPDRLIAAAEDRFGRVDGALVSVGGTPPGTVATTPDEAWRAAFESVFLGAVRVAWRLGTHLAGKNHEAPKTALLRVQAARSALCSHHQCAYRSPNSPCQMACSQA
jgi:3-oxoacyl-[acyl-carrier protein] reductase